MRKLTSDLQSSLFKDQEEKHLINFVKRIDVNRNDEVSQDDLKAFIAQNK